MVSAADSADRHGLLVEKHEEARRVKKVSYKNSSSKDTKGIFTRCEASNFFC